MIFSIENEFVKATVNQKGAELSSYINKENGINYLWKGDAKYWGKHAPVLFPVIGKVTNDSIKVEGVVYPMAKHGFARDSNFELRKQTLNSLEFVMVSAEETKKSYPFDFEFVVKYTLSEKTLITSFAVKNTGKTPLPFSVGGHPAFACPINEEGNLNDCYLEFKEVENADNVLLNPSTGFRNGEFEKGYLQGRKLALHNDIFKNDALVFFNLKSSEITIKSNSNRHELKFSFEGFPQFGIWAPIGAPFVCLEPWAGVCDEAGHDGEFKDRFATVEVQTNHIYSCSYIIEGK